MKELMIILFSAILVNNYPLSEFLGICPFLGVSKKLDSAVGMSAAVIFVMLMATAATWPIYVYAAGAQWSGLPADYRIHSGYRRAGTAGRDHPQEVCSRPV